ncbi:MAG: DNA/RNA non-specific endonuclease [Nitrospira sp.]
MQLKRYEEREQRRKVFESTAYRELRRVKEKQIGATLDFVDMPPDQKALKAGRAVCRLVTLGDRGIVPEGFATGFLIASDLILTNHHVFRTLDEAQNVGAQFLYERTQKGLRQGAIFALEPERFFLNHKALDYAVVAVSITGLSGEPLSQFQFLPLIAEKGKILKGNPVSIIQHPQGKPKQYATVNNRLLDLRDDGFFLYETDTLEGSSGSPVFNQHWETIGLHHCGVPLIENGMLVTLDDQRVPLDADIEDSDLKWIANEGIRTSALVASFADQRLDRPDQQRFLDKLIETTKDPLRMVDERSPLLSSQATAYGSSVSTGEHMAQNIFQFNGPVTIYTGNLANPMKLPAEAQDVAKVISPVELKSPEKKLRFDENYKTREKHGYKSDYLDGWEIPLPELDDEHRGDALSTEDGIPWVINYYHYSIVMSDTRRLLIFAASNADYSDNARKHTKTRKEYGGEDWRLDPRVALAAPGLQIENEHFYAPAKKIDRGHIVRREDSAWGADAEEAEFGNSDTYHWTNCTPQSEGFNQSSKDGIWGKFEEHIQREVKAVGHKMSIFSGPVLNPGDPKHGYDGITIQVPMEFWKVVVCTAKENGNTKHYAYGFVFDQTEPVERLGFERMNMDDFSIYQIPIKAISQKTGLIFDPSIVNADVLAENGGEENIKRFMDKEVRSLENIVLR